MLPRSCGVPFPFILGVLALLGASRTVAQEIPGAETATIELVVTLTDHVGLPIAEAPIEAGSLVESRWAMTNANGQISFTIRKLVDEETINVRLSDGLFTPIVPPAERRRASERFHELRESHAFKPCYLIDVSGESPHEATIATKASVTVSGRVIDAKGRPMVTNIGVRNSNTYSIILPGEAGEFSMGGVAKGEPCEVWVAGTRSQLTSMRFNRIRLSADCSLGDIVIEETPCDATLRLTIRGMEHVSDPSKMDIRNSLTLVGVDDAEIHVFGVNSHETVFATDEAKQPTADLPIPSGEYYVLPGGYGSVGFFALVDSVRAGRQAALNAAGVPRITIDRGETVTHELENAVASLEAVMKVGGDLVCACGGEVEKKHSD